MHDMFIYNCDVATAFIYCVINGQQMDRGTLPGFNLVSQSLIAFARNDLGFQLRRATVDGLQT